MEEGSSLGPSLEKYFFIFFKAILIFALPLSLVLVHLGSSFFGADFQFPINKIDKIWNVLYAWNSSYLGEDNFVVSGFIVLIFLKIIYKVFGFEYGPIFFFYISLVLYLFAWNSLLKCLRKVFSYSESFLVDILILIIVFVSPAVLGYIINYFTINLIFYTSFILFSLKYLLLFVNEKNLKHLLFSILSLSLVLHPPTFLMYFSLFFLIILYFSNLKILFFSTATTIFLNAYWIFPLVLSMFDKDSVSLSKDSSYVEHMFKFFNDSASIFNSGIFSIYPGSKLFDLVPISIFLWMYFSMWISIFLFLAFNKKKKKEKTLYLSFFVIPLLLTILISLGTKYSSGVIFKYFWSNFDFVKFFKSFTQILNIGLVYFISAFYISILYLRKAKILFGIVSAGLVLCLIFVLVKIPGINNYISRGKVPNEYFKAARIINNDGEINRVLIAPAMNYDIYFWNNTHSNQFISQSLFSKPTVSFDEFTPSISREILKQNPDMTNFLVDGNFRYILVHKDYDDSKYKERPIKFQQDYFDVIKTTDYFDLLRIKNEYFSPLIFGENIYNFEKKNETEYSFRIKSLKDSQKVFFLQKFDSDWSLYAVNQKNRSMVNIDSISNHGVYKDYFNQWEIGRTDIASRLQKDYYIENSDGSMEVEFSIRFKKQNQHYFYFSLSAIAFLGCISYLIYATRKNIGNFFRKIVSFVGRRKGKKKIKTGSEKR